MGQMFGKGSLYHLIQVGARISPVENLLFYACPIFFWSSKFRPYFIANGLAQLSLFLPVVLIPANITGHMLYVDIGWPTGVALMAGMSLWMGDGDPVRKWAVGGCMLLHGLRMGIGALVAFHPYRFKEDLPRYKYAKDRFVAKDGMSPKLWPVKKNHDMLQQAYCNSAILNLPIALCAFNKNPWNTPGAVLEVAGIALWGACWIYENRADFQKVAFLKKAKEMGVRNGVLGHPPFNGPEFSLWTQCRHPNYFGEWMSWNGFILSCLPSLFQLKEELWVKLGYGTVLFFLSRFFYDCLNFWTGAEPAEHYSVQKRPEYQDYQESTRVFFPFEMPFFNHCRERGWPFLPQVMDEPLSS